MSGGDRSALLSPITAYLQQLHATYARVQDGNVASYIPNSHVLTRTGLASARQTLSCHWQSISCATGSPSATYSTCRVCSNI